MTSPSTDTTAPATEPAATEPPATGQPTTSAPAAPAPATEPAKPAAAEGKTFTQAELDRFITERLDRERKTLADQQAAERKKLAAALGIEDPDAPVDPAKALEDERAGRTQAEQRADRAEAKALALAAGIDPKRVDRFVKLCEIGEALKGVDRSDETAVEAAIKGAVDAAIEDVPEFKGSTLPASSGGDRSGGKAQTVTLEQFKAMDVDARTKLYQENEGLYKQLAAQAKAAAK